MKMRWIIVLAAFLGCQIVYGQNPETIYINQYGILKKVTPIRGNVVEDLLIQHGTDYNTDSLVVRTNAGDEWKTRLSFVDSISFEEPRDLLEKELNWFIKRSIPAYSDDYSSLSGWSSRARWNLANVHDPTVFKADDGYYYMYQTDASYGNAHDQAGGHYMARRSKDMVNWTILGPAMKGDAPSWVLDSCNAVRTRLGLLLLEVRPPMLRPMAIGHRWLVRCVTGFTAYTIVSFLTTTSRPVIRRLPTNLMAVGGSVPTLA